MRADITHITKEAFFSAFLAVFEDSMIVKTIRKGFRGAGLVPLNPQSVISKLDGKLQTPIPVLGIGKLPVLWVSKNRTIRLRQAYNLNL